MSLWVGIVTEKVRASKDFYMRLFDCELVYEGDDAWFGLLRRGACELGFMKPHQASQAESFHAPFAGQGIWVAIEVEDATAACERVMAQGVSLASPLRDEPWGDRHFVVLDPNGIALDVVQRLPTG